MRKVPETLAPARSPVLVGLGTPQKLFPSSAPRLLESGQVRTSHSSAAGVLPNAGFILEALLTPAARHRPPLAVCLK